MSREINKTTHPVTLEVIKNEPFQLYLREHMVGGAGQGLKITVDKNINGDCLIFTVKDKNGSAQYVVTSYSLIEAIGDLHLELANSIRDRRAKAVGR